MTPRKRTRKIWSEDEEQFVRQHYVERGPRWIAEQLGRTYDSVVTRAYRQGLVDSREMLTPATAAKQAGVSRDRVMTWVHGHGLPHVRTSGGHIRFCPVRFKHWVSTVAPTIKPPRRGRRPKPIDQAFIA